MVQLFPNHTISNCYYQDIDVLTKSLNVFVVSVFPIISPVLVSLAISGACELENDEGEPAFRNLLAADESSFLFFIRLTDDIVFESSCASFGGALDNEVSRLQVWRKSLSAYRARSSDSPALNFIYELQLFLRSFFWRQRSSI